MINVGTGNLLLQADDVDVPHKGIDLAFRRTYNSQSLHDASGSDGAPPSAFGNGWTNTFDAHVVKTSVGNFSVYDIDGARYDYHIDGARTAHVPFRSVTPGQHAQLVWDGTCGLTWTKKTGTTYYFWFPSAALSCPAMGSTVGLYAGRLYQIIGRNSNNTITFSYTWTSANPPPGVNAVASITATTESGLAATLTFGSLNGRSLLTTLQRPDGNTVLYNYDSNGNLTDVQKPGPTMDPNQRIHEWYGYAALANGYVLQSALSPRWAVSNGGCSDTHVDCGGYLQFGYSPGATVSTATLNEIDHVGYVDPTINDGSSNGLVQPLPPNGSGQAAAPHLAEFYTLYAVNPAGPGYTPTFRDTDGHYTNWIVDAAGRPVQTQACPSTSGSPSSGMSCTVALLATAEQWDADNNQTAQIEPRGMAAGANAAAYETDYAYDANGNTVAVAQPEVSTPQGTFRPTSLYSYDAFSNVTAYCDPNASHSLSSDWTSAPSGDALCPITSLLATRFIWSTDSAQSGTSSANPAYEPFGELQARIAPGTAASSGGYRVNYSYDSSRQGGADYGLPTTVSAALAMSQADGTQRQPAQNFWYDGNGWLGCYDSGSGTWALAYDSLGRLVSAADPDDTTAGPGICGKASGMPGWSTASTNAYFLNGSVSSKQSAPQRAAGVSSTFAYDADGNDISETHHFGCVSTSSCAAGVTNKWYDGTDRLVEVSLPYDAYDIQGYPMMTRYVYDLSQGGTSQYRGTGLRGYGNLVKTQELLSGTVITPFTYATSASFTPFTISTGAWTDVRATSFDGLDRTLASYEAAFATQPKSTNTYDGPPPAGGPPQLGFLSSVRLATNEVKQYAYDAAGHPTDTAYSNDNAATPGVHVRYDASGRVVSRGTDAIGNEVLQYDYAGQLTSITKPSSLGGITLTYGYYGDGTRADLSFSSAAYSATPLYQYSYRPDGRRSSLKLNNSAFSWIYTPAGRLQTQRDPFTGRTITPTNFYTVGNSPVRHYYYPSSLTYVPETYSYDGYGRAIGVTLPAGVFAQSFAGFDLESGVTGMSAQSTQAPSNVVTGTCAASNMRNEKMPTYQGSCIGRFYNGAAFAAQPGAAPSNGGSVGLAIAPWTLDARAGMLKSWQGPTQADGNASSGQFSYDASGRLTADAEQLDRPWRESDGTMTANRVYSTGTRTKTYDAENRLRSQQTSPATGYSLPSWGESNPGGYWNDVEQGSLWELQAVDYSADSHPVRFAATQTPDAGIAAQPTVLIWQWDGNDVLAQCGYDNTRATQCASYGFSVEGLADYYPANGYISVKDIGISGQVVTSHDATTFAGMRPMGRTSRTLWSGGVNAVASPDSDGSGLGGNQAGPGPNPYAAGKKIAPDGWTLDNNTWQGVRTYDASVGQWNTPDAYAGDVDDPMSQKPFMWNRNNPYAYGDPSGFAPGPNEGGKSFPQLAPDLTPGIEGYRLREAQAVAEQLNAQNAGFRTVDEYRTYQRLVAEAEARYPLKAGNEKHHVEPQYLGGAKDSPTVTIPAAYHQVITNAFRELARYGTGSEIQRAPAEVKRILDEVYRRLPIPGGYPRKQ